jgi:hypothetical protein
MAQHGPIFRFKTECPRCGNISEIGSDELSPIVSCGNCLMNDVEIVHLKLTRLPNKEQHNDR